MLKSKVGIKPKKTQAAIHNEIRAILLGVLVCCLIVFFVMFSVSADRNAEWLSRQYIEEATDALSEKVDTLYQDGLYMLGNSAHFSAHLLDAGFPVSGLSESESRAVESVEQANAKAQLKGCLNFLVELKKNSLFDYVSLIDARVDASEENFDPDQPNLRQFLNSAMLEEGVGEENIDFTQPYEEVRDYLYLHALDVSDRDYYWDALKGNTGIACVENASYSKEKLFIFYTPVYEVSEPSRVRGVLTGSYRSGKMKSLITSFFFGKESRVLILSPDGTVVERTGASREPNIFKLIPSVNVIGEEDRETSLKEALASGKSLTFSYDSQIEGAEVYGTLRLLEESKSNRWVLMQLFPSKVTSVLVGTTSRPGLILAVELILWFFAVGTVFLWMAYDRRREMKYQNERLSLVISKQPGLLTEQRIGETKVRISGDADRVFAIESGDADQGELMDLIHPEDCVRFHSAYAEVAKGQTDSATTEIRLKKATGDYAWVEYVLYPLKSGSDTVKEVIGIANNVDKQLRALERNEGIIVGLSEAYTRLLYIDTRTQEYVFLKDDTLYRDLPKKDSVEKLKGVFVERCVSPDDAEAMSSFLNRRTAATQKFRLSPYSEIEYRTKIGNRWERLTMIAVAMQGDDVLTAILATQDITHQKEEEISSRIALEGAYKSANIASQAKTNFLSRMSHDIRTPMNVIIGMTLLARSKPEDAEYVQDCLSKIAISGNHLLGLLNEVLDMSKIEDSSFELNETPFDLEAMLRSFAELARPVAEAKGHVFEIETQPIAHREVVGDRQRLEQVLMNLISNAAKYTPDGGKITFTAKELDETDDAYYEFTVEDNGVGMTPEQVERIFEPFYRAQDTRISKIEGTGLGLSIALSVVRLMNGIINVESLPGQGSKFSVRVRLRRASGEIGAECEKSIRLMPETKRNYKGKRALIVEDNELNLEIAKEIVGLTEITIETAADGNEAVQAFRNSPIGYYDIVFMDIQMPECNGVNATKRIRALSRKDAKSVPIVAMTANAFADDIMETRLAGMNAHIAKPIEPGILFTIMDRFLGGAE